MKTTSLPIFDEPHKIIFTRKEVACLAGVCTQTVAVDVKKGLLRGDGKNCPLDLKAKKRKRRNR
jgi:hypothetical protein